jgi:hypothetical protein
MPQLPGEQQSQPTKPTAIQAPSGQAKPGQVKPGPNFERWMAIGRQIMQEDANILKALADK